MDNRMSDTIEVSMTSVSLSTGEPAPPHFEESVRMTELSEESPELTPEQEFGYMQIRR
jgi:hypothetical protein